MDSLYIGLMDEAEVYKLEPQALVNAVLDAYDWSQRSLARRLGRNPMTINAWVHGRSEPRWKDLQRLQKLLGTAPGGSE